MKLHKIATNTTSGLTTSVYMSDDMIATNISSNTMLQGEDILLRHNIDKKALYIEYRPVHPILQTVITAYFIIRTRLNL